MFKLMDRIEKHWGEKAYNNPWYNFVIAAEAIATAIAAFGISYIIASCLIQNGYFTSLTSIDLSIYFFLFFLVSLVFLVIAHGIHSDKEKKKTKERLENSPISDYVEKYQKYADLVENLLPIEYYSGVRLAEDWLKQFDRHLTNTAKLCQEQEKPFTDFELVACLMYSLTSLMATDINFDFAIDFAFLCAKDILNCPAVYICNYLDGGELDLKVQKTYGYIDFSVLTPEQDTFLLSLLECYLSRRDTYDQFLGLADFLQVLYMYSEQ